MSRGGLLVQVLSGKNFLGDDSGNTHHGGTAVVELGVLLTNLLGRLLLPVVDLSKPNAVVAIKLGGGPPGKLNESRNNEDLSKSGSGVMTSEQCCAVTDHYFSQMPVQTRQTRR